MRTANTKNPDGLKKIPVSREHMWNGLTIMALLATLAVVVVLLVMIKNPASGGAQNPPSAGYVRLQPSPTHTVTVEPTATNLPPTETLTSAVTPVNPTEMPSPQPSPTPALIVVEATPAQMPSPEPTMDPTAASKFAFGSLAQPQGIAASLYQPTRGCAWMGVAGRVFDIQNRPVKGIRVQLTGWLNGHTVNLLSLTGTALQYGPSGYEFTLAEAPQATIGLFKIQLLDQSDLPLSGIVVFDTHAECEKNLILVDFKQINE